MAKEKEYDRQTGKFLAVVAQNMPPLSGEEMQQWIGSPAKLSEALTAALKPAIRVSMLPAALKVFKAIKIGTGVKFGKAFCSELEQKDCGISNWARDILGQPAFTVATQEEDVDLVNLSVADLGFKKGARYDDICARAIEIGLKLCPAEVGPQLRLQYPDQPMVEWFVIAMEAIRDSDGSLVVFGVGHGSRGRWLGSSCGEPDYFWLADDRFVFRARKKPLVL